ncbi:family 16 glycosylhydrolase [Geodermatophilus sp. SYSU D00758]
MADDDGAVEGDPVPPATPLRRARRWGAPLLASLAGIALVLAFGRVVDDPRHADAGRGAPTATAAPTEPPRTDGPPGDPAGWVQVFGDEFDGDTLDRSRWRPSRYDDGDDDGPYNPTVEGAYYSEDNVSVRDGSAVLEVRPEPATVEGVDHTHSSGVITTEGTFALQDGDYLEARVRVPTGDGLWPAFWTHPLDRWPPEIDVFEYFDTTLDSRPTFVYHFPGRIGFRGETSRGVYGDAGTDYREGWHTYGMYRVNGRITVHLDGQPQPEVGVPIRADDLPHYVILNLAVYAGKQPEPGSAVLVDWVRVWRPVPS